MIRQKQYYVKMYCYTLYGEIFAKLKSTKGSNISLVKQMAKAMSLNILVRRRTPMLITKGAQRTFLRSSVADPVFGKKNPDPGLCTSNEGRSLKILLDAFFFVFILLVSDVPLIS